MAGNSIGSTAVVLTGDSSQLAREIKKVEGNLSGLQKHVAGASSLMGKGLSTTVGAAFGPIGKIVTTAFSTVTSPVSLIAGGIGGLSLGGLLAESISQSLDFSPINGVIGLEYLKPFGSASSAPPTLMFFDIHS